jgi:hypothetical protein
MVAAAAVWLELALLNLGGLALFLRWGYTLAEAGTYAVISVTLLLSLVLQLGFWSGLSCLPPFLEILCVSIAAGLAFRQRALLARRWHGLRRSFPGPRGTAWVFGVGLIYLGLQCFMLPPSVNHWPDLAGLLWHHRPPPLESYAPAGAGLCLEPLNVSVLANLFLRFPTDFGVAGLGAMGYLAIVFGTYALARRHAWPATAFTVALIVAGLPRLVLQASTPGLEILPAAVALFCILCLYRLIEQSHWRDFVLLGLGLAFIAFSGRLGLWLSATLALVAAVLLLRRHTILFWWGLIRRSWPAFLAAVPAALVLSSLWRPAAGCPAIAYNDDGLIGALDHAFRYLLEIIHLPSEVERLSRWAFGFSPIQWMEGLQTNLACLLPAQRAAPRLFSVAWLPDEVLSWFGPLAFCLILPAIVYAARRGARRLRMIAVALVGYFYLAALIPAWTPGNAGLFTAWFACAGYLVAFLLPPWRISARGHRVLQAVSLVMMFYALTLNVSKPAFGRKFLGSDDPSGRLNSAELSLFLPDRFKTSIWLETRWGLDRWRRARQLFGDRRVEICSAALASGVRVGVLAQTAGQSYPFLAARPDVNFQWIDPEVYGDIGRLRRLQLGHVLFVDQEPLPAPAGAAVRVLWKADPTTSRLPGGLVQVR